MKRVLKKVIAALILIAIGVLGGWWLFQMEERPSASEITLYGNIDIRSVDLAFTEQERIVEVLVQEGDRVDPGRVLARQQTNRLDAQIEETQARIAAQQQVVNRLETGTRPQEIEQARAEVDAARVKADNSRRNLERIRQTSETGATSQQDEDDARARADGDDAQLKVREKALNLALEGPRKEDVAAAKATMRALEASLTLLNIRLADTTLTAPASGVIQNRILEPGDMGGPARPVVTLALIDPKWVRAYVTEPDLGLIHLGMKAVIISDSFPDRTFKGWIGFISPVAEFTPKSVETTDLRTKLVYETRVYVNDPKDLLRLGMPVTVTVDKAGSDAPSQQERPATSRTSPSAGAQGTSQNK
jgi:HlyD family secretion protein